MTVDIKKDADFKFPLGARAKDVLTGFEGVIIYRTQWLTNCNVYGLKPTTLDKDGMVRKGEQFDEPRIELIEENVFTDTRENKTGEPCDSMKQTNRS